MPSDMTPSLELLPVMVEALALRSASAFIWRVIDCLGGRLGQSVNLLRSRSAAASACPGVTAVRPGSLPYRARSGHGTDPAIDADGPNRAPGRYEVPLSNGTPATATSQRLTSSRRGSSANVGGPAKRGVLVASMGPRSAPGLPSVSVNLPSCLPGW